MILPAALGILLFAANCVAAGQPVQQPAPQAVIAFPSEDGSVAPWNRGAGPDAPLLFTDVLIDGRRARAMVDTGVTFTALDTEWVRRAGLWRDGTAAVALSATGGPARATLGPVVKMDLPPYRIAKLQTLVADLAGAGRVTGGAIDLMLGMNVIGAGSLELDLGNRRWRLGRGGLTWPRAATAALRYTEDRYHSYVEIAVEDRVLRLGIDTGYNGGVMLTNAAAAGTGLLDQSRTTTIAAQGLGGIAVQQMAIPARLRLGTLELADVSVEVEAAKGLPSQWRLDGIIGTGLLARLHAALDFPAGVMFYVVSDATMPVAVRSTIGLQVQRQDGGFAVVHVMANGPAANAGWKVGERICAVDGTTVAAMPVTAGPNRWNTAPPGTTVRFLMCDGRSRSLLARHFYGRP